MRRVVFLLLMLMPLGAYGQGSIAMAPARFELEMKPGQETTVVVNLDFKADAAEKPVRIVASLNDWSMGKEGEVSFFPAGSRNMSACPWLIYSPGEAVVAPGALHQIRITVSVPENATPGDHLAALIVEQRPENLKFAEGTRQMVVRYRLATVFYIKVGGLTRKGALTDLLAQANENGIVVTPTLRNEGNSMIRPVTELSIYDEAGQRVANIPPTEDLPVLANSELAQPRLLDSSLAVGKYTLKYRVDFQDGRPVTEGVTDLVITPQIAKVLGSRKKTN
ncbi:MAG: hypothetical protein ACJ73D_02960 [Pyrinomonadaceae bacterium]